MSTYNKIRNSIEELINTKFLSKWSILAIDIIILFFSAILAYLLRFNFSIPPQHAEGLLFNILILMGSVTIGFLFTSSYKGILRLSGIYELIKLSTSMLIGIFILLIIFYSSDGYINNHPLYPLSVLIIYIFISSLILIVLRIVVKVVYSSLWKSNISHSRTLIYGAGRAGRITLQVIHTSNKASQLIVGFIDDDPNLIGKRIDGVKIYSSKVLTKDFIQENKIQEIIFSIIDISPQKKSEIIQNILDIGIINLLEAPHIDKWVNGMPNITDFKKFDIEDLLQRKELNSNVKCNFSRGKI